MSIRLNKEKAIQILMIVGFTVIIHILYLNFYKDVFRMSYNRKMFIYSFNPAKYCFCIAESLLIIFFINKKVKKDTLTDMALLILYFLYFIPGFVQQAVTDMAWSYIIYYFFFLIFLELWNKIIKPRTRSTVVEFSKSKRLLKNNKRQIMVFLICTALLVTIFMSLYTRTFFSISNLMLSLNDVYGIRHAASEANTHWLIVNFEYWAVYFMIFMIAFFSEKRKWWLVLILMAAVAAMFIIQANRVFLFLAIVALFLGLLRVDNKRIIVLFGIAGLILLVDVVIFKRGSMITDIFRRFTVVPNRLGEQYFDYFLSHQPDFLRTQYDRVVRYLGIPSPYYSPNIGHIIGQTYYGTNMGANTGMVGAGMFSFGYLGVLISTFGYVMAFRLFEGITYNYRESRMTVAIAITLVTISINTPNLLSNIFSISYVLMLYLSMLVLNPYSWQKRKDGFE